MYIFLALEYRRRGEHLWVLVGQGSDDDVAYWRTIYTVDRGYLAVKVIDGGGPDARLRAWS